MGETTVALLANSSDAKKQSAPRWPPAKIQILHNNAFNTVFWMQVHCTELRFFAKSRRHFLFRYSDIENILIMVVKQSIIIIIIKNICIAQICWGHKCACL